jgi:hypothetical protein
MEGQKHVQNEEVGRGGRHKMGDEVGKDRIQNAWKYSCPCA